MPRKPVTHVDPHADAVSRFKQQRPTYVKLARELPKFVEKRLKKHGLVHFRIEARAKKLKSFKAKLAGDPQRQIEDHVGVRVLLFFRSDLPLAEKVFEKLLIIDPSSYVDKSEGHDDDSFGYRSVQFVGRTKQGGWDSKPGDLEAMAPMMGTKIEVQLRTMVEHAWAEVEHDFRFKIGRDKLSPEINRRFALTAALLEQADTNLDSIRAEVDSDAVSPAGKSRGMDLSQSELRRFVQYNRESLALDRRVASALDLPIRKSLKATREITHASMNAGWRTYTDLVEGVKEHGNLGLRLAIACADTSRSLILLDYDDFETARAFKGVGLYWTAIAATVVDPQTDMSDLTMNVAITPYRLAEFRDVATHLRNYPGQSAREVRDVYRPQAAPVGTRNPDAFSPIIFPTQ